MILLGLDKYDDALASFNKATELAPRESDVFTSIGASSTAKRASFQKALEQLNKVLELAPDSIGTLLVRAGVYYEMKTPDRALEDIDSAIKLQPALAQPHLMRAEVLAATDSWIKRIGELEHLLQTSPGNVPLLNRLGSFYLIANRPRKAIETATKILSQHPDDFPRCASGPMRTSTSASMLKRSPTSSGPWRLRRMMRAC